MRLALRQLDERVVAAAAAAGGPSDEELANAAQLVATAGERIQAEFMRRNPDAEPISWSTLPDSEHSAHRLVGDTRHSGVAMRSVLDTEFMRAAEYTRLSRLAQTILEVGSPPFSLQAGDNEAEELATAVLLLVRILSVGRKGLTVQRYKGLGEMNADQLADTTMDRATRTMLQVRVEDAVEADLVFTTLMGEDVEPRRSFIEANALNVENLDV